jgi:CubicO group peptidase (beta-lactamase class C family)
MSKMVYTSVREVGDGRDQAKRSRRVKKPTAATSAADLRFSLSEGGIGKNLTLLLVFMSALLLAGCSSSGEQQTPPAVDPAELEAFADTFFPAKMEELHIPGVAFIFVENGEVVFAKGYGYADLYKRIPMSADTTVMRIGSVSKVFVATAVMQLVEQGKLDLDADINQYLTTFQMEDSFDEPVTLAQLLTHTAGFEDPPYVSNTDPALVRPLGPYLAESMPARNDPPGATFRYSSHGFALAAYVVEEVSGQPFDQYVAEHIMRPLGMTRSGYLLSPPLPEGLAVGYSYQYETQIPQPVDYDSDYPGASIVSTAADMARFMLAHLQDGCYEGACILQPETAAEMHRSRADTPYEGQRVTYGFTEGIENGQRLLGHSGAIRGFGSIMDLLPEHNMGYFFSFNEECYQTSACDLIPAFREQFLERFISQ